MSVWCKPGARRTIDSFGYFLVSTHVVQDLTWAWRILAQFAKNTLFLAKLKIWSGLGTFEF